MSLSPWNETMKHTHTVEERSSDYVLNPDMFRSFTILEFNIFDKKECTYWNNSFGTYMFHVLY